MSKKKNQVPPAAAKKDGTGKKVKKNSALLFVVSLVAMLAIFGGRWVWAIMEEYYGAFVTRYSASVEDAVSNMQGLTFTEGEKDILLPLQQEWDLFTSARLRDEVKTTAEDGTELHGYLYNEGADVTVVVLRRFHGTGTDDFLPGAFLNGLTGCNLLLPDARNHGESGGESFTYGHLEQHDLVCWLEWAEETLGDQTFILWGEGVGANTILFAEASGILPESVAFAVAESPFDSLHEMAKTQIKAWYTVPAFPFLTAVELKVNQGKGGFVMADTDLGAALEGADCTLPVLFLQTVGDKYIYPEWSSAVFDAYSGEKEQIAGGDSHGMAYTVCQDEVEALLTDWVNTYTN